MTKNEEESEVEGEENLDKLVDIVTFDDCLDDSVRDEKLNDDVDRREAKDEPLVSVPAEHSEAVEVNHTHFLHEALHALVILVLFKSLIFLILSHELLGLSKSTVLFSLFLNIFLSDLDECVLQTVQLNINLHFGELLLNSLNQRAYLVNQDDRN